MISSQLGSQLFSKLATKWIIVRKNLAWSESDPWLENLKIQVFDKCILVSLPKNPMGGKGFSLFLSMWEYLDYFTNRSTTKAEEIDCFRMSNFHWIVESYQKYSDKYTVTFYPGKISCNCMLYKCLANRIQKECPYFAQLMKLDDFFAGNVVCHHIYRVLNELGHWDLRTYLDSGGRKRAA